MSGITEIVVVDTADHVGVRVSQGTDMVFVLCRKDAFDGRWYAIASVDTTVRAVKEHAEFGNRDDAATEAAEMLFGLTERFMPVAHRELFGEVKRTPETVLRAMLKAYQDAHVEAAKAFLKARDDYSKQFDLNLTGQAEYRLDVAEEAYLDVLLNLASWTVDETTDFEIEFVDADYRARLAGERPFDAHHEALSFALSKVHARESEEVYNMKQEILDRYQHAGRAEMLLHLDKLTAAVRDGIERPIFDAAYMSKSPSDAIDKWMKEP